MISKKYMASLAVVALMLSACGGPSSDTPAKGSEDAETQSVDEEKADAADDTVTEAKEEAAEDVAEAQEEAKEDVQEAKKKAAKKKSK